MRNFKIYYKNKGFALIDQNGNARGCLHYSEEWILPKGNYNFYSEYGIYHFTGEVYDKKDFKQKLEQGHYFEII